MTVRAKTSKLKVIKLFNFKGYSGLGLNYVKTNNKAFMENVQVLCHLHSVPSMTRILT